MEQNSIELKPLKGYQKTNPDLNLPGITVSYGGSSFNIFGLKLKNINIHQVAISLARQPRYMGHTKHSYSIAQHSVRGAEALLLMGYVNEAIAFLFHDAAEAFISDISTPLKRYLDSEGKISEIETKLDFQIFKFFGIEIEWLQSPLIKFVDKNLAQEEMTVLMAHQEIHAKDWYWTEEYSYSRFIEMFNKLKCIKTYQEPFSENNQESKDLGNIDENFEIKNMKWEVGKNEI